MYIEKGWEVDLMLVFLYGTLLFLLYVWYICHLMFRFIEKDTTDHDMRNLWMVFPVTRKEIRKSDRVNRK